MTARAARRRNDATIAAGREVRIRRLTDRSALEKRLAVDRAFSAYALAYLDPALFGLAQFYVAESAGQNALVMHARGGLGQTTLLIGDAALVPALIDLHPGPGHTLLTCQQDHVDLALATYHLWRPQAMLRMQLDSDAFAPPPSMPSVRRLIAADNRELNWLYALEGDRIHYSPAHLRQEVYYGVYQRGRLVAAAGTHIHSRAQGVAVVGDVFTHPDFRGRGYGTAVTAAVSAHLLQSHSLVVLSVDPANRVAHRIYEQMGYRDAGRMVEAMATRRRSYSPLPLLRRLAARWRSDTPGTEVVQN